MSQSIPVIAMDSLVLFGVAKALGDGRPLKFAREVAAYMRRERVASICGSDESTLALSAKKDGDDRKTASGEMKISIRLFAEDEAALPNMASFDMGQ